MALRGEGIDELSVLEAKRDARSERGTAFSKHAARDLPEKWKRGTAVAVADSLFVDVSVGTHVAPAAKDVQPEVLRASAQRELGGVCVGRHAAIDHAVFDFAAMPNKRKALPVERELEREAKEGLGGFVVDANAGVSVENAVCCGGFENVEFVCEVYVGLRNSLCQTNL